MSANFSDIFRGLEDTTTRRLVYFSNTKVTMNLRDHSLDSLGYKPQEVILWDTLLCTVIDQPAIAVPGSSLTVHFPADQWIPATHN